jgi:hypothetical protein
VTAKISRNCPSVGNTVQQVNLKDQKKTPSQGRRFCRIDLLAWLYQRALIRTHWPFAVSDGHDLPWLLDEFVPGFATQGDNIIV